MKPSQRRPGPAPFVLGCALLCPLPAPEPHLAGENSADQVLRLTLSAEGLKGELEVDLAEFPAEDFRRTLDRDRDGQITPEEERAWLARGSRELMARLKIEADGGLLAPRIVREGTAVALGRREVGPLPLRIRLAFQAAWPEGGAPPRTVAVGNLAFARHPGFVRAYLAPPEGWAAASDLDAAVDLDRYEELNRRINAQTGSAETLPREEWPPQVRQVSWRLWPEGEASTATPAAGAKSPEARAGAEPPEPSNAFHREVLRFFDALKEGRLQWVFMLLALLYGAGHALSPGHGKAITGAFLIGARGTPRDAILLGLVVTVTHTFAVYALGIAYIFLWEGVDRGLATGILEVSASLLIVAIGLFLVHTHGLKLLGRWRAGAWLVRGLVSLGVLGVASLLAHHGQPWFLVAGLGGYLVWTQWARRAGGHGHEHAHEHGHPHEHGHAHEHGHPSNVQSAGTSLWQILGIGVQGGIVPCPTGLVIVSLSMTPAIDSPWIGLLLVTAFSLGMAAVLVGIGLATVKGMGLVVRFGGPRAELAMVVVPFLSALFIAALGVSLTLGALPGSMGP